MVISSTWSSFHFWENWFIPISLKAIHTVHEIVWNTGGSVGCLVFCCCFFGVLREEKGAFFLISAGTAEKLVIMTGYWVITDRKLASFQFKCKGKPQNCGIGAAWWHMTSTLAPTSMCQEWGFQDSFENKTQVMGGFCLCTFCYLPTTLISAVRLLTLLPLGYLYVPWEGGQSSYLSRSRFKNVSSEIQLKHSSALTTQPTTARAATGLPEEEISWDHSVLERNCSHVPAGLIWRISMPFWSFSCNSFSPALSSTMKYPIPHRQ